MHISVVVVAVVVVVDVVVVRVTVVVLVVHTPHCAGHLSRYALLSSASSPDAPMLPLPLPLALALRSSE